jgi:hypothetical protein
MKICVIGNSHVACLRAAWDGLEAQYSEHTLTFFAGPMLTIAELSLDESSGQLVPTSEALTESLQMTSGGAESIALKAYDFFLLVGMGFHLPMIPKGYSRAVREGIAKDTFGETPSARVAAMTRLGSEAPIFIVPVPLPIHADGSASPLTTLPPRDVAALCSSAHASSRLRFIAQPAATLEGEWFTQAKFLKDAPRLAHTPRKVGKAFGEKNLVHMNADYGAIWLNDFFAKLQPAGPAAGEGGAA